MIKPLPRSNCTPKFSVQVACVACSQVDSLNHFQAHVHPICEVNWAQGPTKLTLSKSYHLAELMIMAIYTYKVDPYQLQVT